MLTAEQREIISEARSLITPEERWTAGAFARDGVGRKCSPMSPEAVSFSANGVLVHVASKRLHDQRDVWPYADIVRKHLKLARSLWEINDADGHAAVLTIFDKALAD